MLRLLHYQKGEMNNDVNLKKKANPLIKANFLSKLTYFYMFKVMGIAVHHEISEEDTFEVLPEHKSSVLGRKLEIYWLTEKKKHRKYALHRALFRMFGTRFMLFGIVKLLEELSLILVMPLSIGKIVTYFEKDQKTVSQKELYIYSSVVIITLYVNAIFSHYATFHLLHISMKMRIACSSLMYRKALKMSKSSLERTTVGNIITMLSSDVGKFEQGFFLSHFIWIAPILTMVALYLLYRQIALSSVWGIIFLFSFIPIQVLLGNMTSAKRIKIAQRTDERVRLMHELLTGIQAIKMYCWEIPFSKYVKHARSQEMNAIRSHSYLIGLLYSLEFFITRTSVFISLVVYVLIGNKLAPQKIFVVTAIYNVIKPAVTIVFAISMSALFSVNVALNRIEAFLRNEEFVVDASGFTPNNLRNIDPRDLESNQVSLPIQPRVIVRGVYAKWLDTSDDITLKHLNFDISSGELVAIIGPVGSGKTSLLNVLLREMILTSGEVDIQGRISYASQEPWFFSGSIQQNILFGETHDITRYESVTHVCALLNDFQNFAHGDASLVGERGKALSGGQKARVNLARCIYRKADIYILDDPLSAVDSRIGRHLYQKCIETFLSDKICILVTHQLQYLKTADKIIIMKDGSIEASGTFRELQKSGLDFAKMLESIQAEIEEKESKNIAKGEEKRSEDLPHIEKEKIVHGIVDLHTYWSYLRAGGNYFYISLLIFLIVISHVASFGGDYFVAYWVNLEQVKVVQPRIAYPESIERTRIISIYAILLGCTTATAIWFCLYYANFFSRASRRLHEMMFDRLMQATMSFFSKNSAGKILNRFAKDLSLVDEHIPIVLLEVILIGCFIFGIFLLSTIVEPFLIIPLLVLFIGIYFFRRFYIRTSRSLKRLESVARSPILGHMTSSLEGLPTIRCFNMEEALIEEFDRLQDVHSSSWFLFLASSRCFGFWLDIFSFTFVAISIYFMLLLSSGMNGGNIGLVITQYIGLIGSLQWGMRQWSELENQMVSVERLLEYTRIENEPKRPDKPDFPKNWPPKGKLEFKDVSLRYDETDVMILRNISFVVESGEKVGIVGRTGAGKSSMISALFQLYDLEGDILIDDVNIIKIPLNVSRRKISIIPQEPFLFSGTMRKNLDPFGRYNDEFLWRALEQVELKEVLSDDNKGLDLIINEGGHNLSAGQRQLVCLARALINQNKIIIMDEATANVDPYTDALIQKTIRTRFEDCTLLTVAHRLHTVMDSDKILVMRRGRVEEFDHPYVLLRNPEGFLYHLLKATGESTFQSLEEIARNNYELKYGAKYIRVKPFEMPESERYI